MSILSRFRDIMASNVNALLDKVEDPEKMIEQCLRDLNSDLGKVKAETASIMAQEQRAKRSLDEITEEIEKMQNYAIRSLEANNENDARKFLEKKAALAEKETALREAYDLATANATKMRGMHDKLMTDISELESRKDMIKGKLSVARAQERINKINSSVGSANGSISAFNRMEEKANEALIAANARAELDSFLKGDINDLEEKCDSSNIDNELEALKAKLKKD